MKTMKKFWKYLINFAVLFLIVTGVTYLGTADYKTKARTIQCVALEDTFPIEITESKASRTRATVKGNIANNTKEIVTNKYLQIDFYNENGSYLGAETKEIKFFNATEKIPFDITAKYENASKAEFSLADENVNKDKVKTRISNLASDLNISNAELVLGLFLAWTILPPLF